MKFVLQSNQGELLTNSSNNGSSSLTKLTNFRPPFCKDTNKQKDTKKIKQNKLFKADTKKLNDISFQKIG